MIPLRVLFADDERMARKRMRRLLEATPDVEIVAECESGEDALRELDRIDVDVALLDIRMGRASGLEVSDVASELGVEVIFTTAHREHAIDAFERGVVDYVLKPIEPARLAASIARARQRIDALRPAAPGVRRPSGPVERIALEIRGEVRLLRTDAISHAVHDGQLVSLWVEGAQVWTERSLSDLEALLPADQFERVHRRALLSLAWVDRLKPLPTGGYIAVTRDGREVPVSRQAARGLRRRLGIT
jgi:two-component system LytT family response regulator